MRTRPLFALMAQLSMSLRKLDDELTCPVCTEHFKEPKVLPCLHYYCKTCIADLIKRAKGGPFNCPECRREAQADPESFPTAFFMNRMEEVFSVMKKAEPTENVKCESCSKQPSVAFCHDCSEYICTECEKAHNNMHRFSSHVVVSIDSLRSSIGKRAADLQVFPVMCQEIKCKEVKCSKHKKKSLKLYCHDCHKLVCGDCTLIDHKDHNYAFVVDAAPKCKFEIKQKVESVKKLSDDLKSAVKSLNDSEKELSAHSTATTKAIDDALDRIVSKLMQKRIELKQKARQVVDEVKEKIVIQEKNAQLAVGEVESLLEFMNRNLKIATDQEVLSLEKQISDQVHRVSQLYDNPGGKFPVPQIPELQVHCGGKIEQIIKDEITVKNKADERPRVFSDLNPDALALVQKLSGEIHGIEYHVSEGSVHIQLEGECEAEEAITKFQNEYKKVVARRLRAENVVIPATRSKEEVETQIAKFEEKYTFCAFVLDEEKRHVRVISQTRQFEQAKKFLKEALQKPLEESSAAMIPHSNLLNLKYPGLPQLRENATVGNTASRSGKKNEGARKDTNTKDVCPICLEHFISPMKTKCGHLFCKDCIEKSLQFEPCCPTCKTPLCAIFGKQPHRSTMTHSTLLYSLPGYEGYGAIQINYTVPSGIQGQEHPNPGQRYYGTTRTAFLPNTQDGKEVLLLLQKAFKARMIFTIGTSVTSGAENVVVWNDIHHKTNTSGGPECYGYPDPTYLQRVKEDLAAKGIVPDY